GPVGPGPTPAAPAGPPAAGQPAGPTAAQASLSVSGGGQASPPAGAGQASPGAGVPTAAAPAAPGNYKEAPALADQVKAGKLPPVAQRLPQSPRVLKPLEEVGQYGGAWHRAYTGLSDRVGPSKLQEQNLVKWDAPDPNSLRLAANVVEK